MKKLIVLSALSALMSANAHATVDSFAKVLIPVAQMHSEGFCMSPTLAWDGITNLGTAQMLALSALQRPLKVVGVQAGEDSEGLVDINALSATGITFQFDVDWDGQDHKLAIDVTSAFANLDKAQALKAAKLAIYAGVKNSLDSSIKQVRVKVIGLPAQQGPKPIPASFNSAFSAGSPYLKQLGTELGISTNCNGG